jgi:hypothetical protein
MYTNGTLAYMSAGFYDERQRLNLLSDGVVDAKMSSRFV